MLSHVLIIASLIFLVFLKNTLILKYYLFSKQKKCFWENIRKFITLIIFYKVLLFRVFLQLKILEKVIVRYHNTFGT